MHRPLLSKQDHPLQTEFLDNPQIRRSRRQFHGLHTNIGKQAQELPVSRQELLPGRLPAPLRGWLDPVPLENLDSSEEFAGKRRIGEFAK